MIYALATYFLFNLAIVFASNLLAPKEQEIPFMANLLLMLVGLPMFITLLFLTYKGGK